ncbi:carbamoyl-phosphate synthase large subunit [Urinicoccus timonensis]|uniref:carbamoyl-phosphate synthase large subunit n=1 Tax=Urinicoccus timonensis TaxID=2024205 RepID=UPI000C072900|nr:carbamoyl-phosphate synthase large subunit [Urinicoccus timonensis]
MGKFEGVKKVLVLGSGPIVIGQGAEFDYSGNQACQTLKDNGVEVVLINSNPATIMTDRGMADKIYIEPMTLEVVEKIIEKEKPDHLIPGMGGQTGLNLAMDLHEKGILDKYDVKVLGTPISGIKKGEDRELFRELMEEIDEPLIPSKTVTGLDEALDYADYLGYPVVVRPAFTLGGTGGGIAKTKEELVEIATGGLHRSRVHQVLIEKCITGWKEIEFEVIRDHDGNKIVVCSMENIDPVGVHTGDSIVVAPTQTLSPLEYGILQRSAFKIIDAVGIEGGCNVQFALHPTSTKYAVIEINPRVSRSSALASKATGYPIARVATNIALGYRLDEIENRITKKTSAAFEPVIDYVVVKIPKWPFDKFYNAKRQLGTKMMATGEVMAIGSSFQSALLKGLRSLEIGKFSLEHPGLAEKSLQELKKEVLSPSDERLFVLAELLRRGYSIKRLGLETGIDEFFLYEIADIVQRESKLKEMTKDDLTENTLRDLKNRGFSDVAIGNFIGESPKFIYELRKLYNITASFKGVDTCAGSLKVDSPYLYSSYDLESEEKTLEKTGKKVLVIGSGPIRIGQGIEFDYCCVHCVQTLNKLGYETILMNNNPETVSTDFDLADKLYFEPLTIEDTLNVIDREKPDGVILQFGGQTAIKLADFFKDSEIPIWGTDPDAIDRAEDRERFDELLEELGIQRPKGHGVWTTEEAVDIAKNLGYPVLVRPSYVLGGQGMEICYGETQLRYYCDRGFQKDPKNPILIDQYIDGMEIEVDALCDGEDILVPGIMEHLERAGIHSGDSISIYPTDNIPQDKKEEIVQVTKKIALSLGVIGLVNIQYILKDHQLYIIEVNPRSSRTVPYLSKVTTIPMVDVATELILGKKLKDMGYGTGLYPEGDLVCAKIPVFSTDKLQQVEAGLGPEMRSTGEDLGVGLSRKEALAKGFIASGIDLASHPRRVLVTLGDKDKEELRDSILIMKDMGYSFAATENTKNFLEDLGIQAEHVRKIGEDYPTILDEVKEGKFDLVINTPTKGGDAKRDGFMIRRAAIESDVELLSNVDKAKSLIEILHEETLKDGIKLYELNQFDQYRR